MGSALYTKHDFRILEVIELNPPFGTAEDEANSEWMQCRLLTRGLRCAILVRPVNGSWKGREAEGISPKGDITTNTWEEQVES